MSVGDFASLDGRVAVIVESVWVYEGTFSKALIFHTDFNDFYKTTGWIFSRFGVTLGSLLAYEGDFGSTLRSLCGHFGHIDVEWHV